MRLGLFGTGRLGSAIAEAAAAAPDVELVWQVGEEPAPQESVDVAIEATVAEAVPARVAWALERGTPLVVGTTGWSLAGLAEAVEGKVGLLVAPNFSLAVALMGRLAQVLGRYADLDPDLDPYVLEHHHARKADAPGGTARALAGAVLAGCPRKRGWTLGTAEPHQLSVAVVRAGAEPGRHTVGLDGPLETLTLTHTARSRQVFAAGALRAARWIRGRKGCFTFDDLAADLLDPLFRTGV